MGQNIHAHIEVKHNDAWEHFSAPCVIRDYKLYRLMGSNRDVAGLRTVIGVKPGMPADASIITRRCLELDTDQYGKSIVNTAHVIDAAGIAALQDAYRNARPELSLPESDLEETIFHCYIAGNPIFAHDGFEDVRIVYWFDN